jgi:hypothetical protein
LFAHERQTLPCRSYPTFIATLSMLRLSLAISLTLCCCGFSADESAPRWWKGNLHTHTLWSDGDNYPEMVADWYKQNGYNFLALSDHNILSNVEKWVTVGKTPTSEAALA